MGEKGLTMVFRGGLPFEPDVKRLEEAFPVPELTEGRVIEHVALEAIVQAKRGSSRYYGVINSWINRLRNVSRIHAAWKPGDGIKILPPDELLGHGESRLRQKIGQTVKAANIFAWVERERLDSIGQRRLDHQIQIASRIKEKLTQERRQLSVELSPVRSLPKRQIS